MLGTSLLQVVDLWWQFCINKQVAAEILRKNKDWPNGRVVVHSF